MNNKIFRYKNLVTNVHEKLVFSKHFKVKTLYRVKMLKYY